MFEIEPEEFNIEEMEENEAKENAKYYDIPEVGDIVTVKLLLGEEEFIVIRTDYAVNYVYGEDVRSKHPVIITGWNYRKSIKHQESFHVCHVTEIKQIPKEYADENYVDDWQQHVNKMIKSQIPAVGKTAIIRQDSVLHIIENIGMSYSKKRYKVVGIIERDISPLLVLRPTKHFNGKFEEIDSGYFYMS